MYGGGSMYFRATPAARSGMVELSGLVESQE